MGHALNEVFIGMASWLLNGALVAYALTLAVMGFMLIGTVAGPFARTRRKRGN